VDGNIRQMTDVSTDDDDVISAVWLISV